MSGRRGWTVQQGRPPDVYRVLVPHGQEAAVARRLAAAPGVAYAEPVVQLRAQEVITPTDPLYLSSQWNLQQIGLPTAWATVTGTRSITIAVVDTGVATGHPDLAAQIWRNSREVPGNGVDDDGNGCIDDVAGCNFVTFGTPNGEVADLHGHGTHVAGTAAAAANNGVGIAGVAWNVTILPVRVLDQNGDGWYDDIADGITYAADRGARVINLSLGGAFNSRLMAEAVAYAQARGALIVAAMGNAGDENSPTFYPAAYSGVVAVASTDRADRRSDFSNAQRYTSVAAPGSGIYSTYLYSGYTTMSGTSMATPHAAGLAALILSRQPGLSPAQVKSVLEQSAAVGHWTAELGWGRLDAAAAVTLATPTTAVAGRVTTPDNRPAAGATLDLAGTRVVADQDGWYHIPVSPTTSTLTVTAAAAGFMPTVRPVSITGGVWQHANLVLDWPANVLTNGSFERGLSGWSAGGTPSPSVTTTMSVDGGSAAFLGYLESSCSDSDVPAGTATITRTVTLPPRFEVTPTLSFVYRLDTIEDPAYRDYPCIYDCFVVTVGNPLSGTSQTILSTDVGTDWQQVTADLAAYAGQTIVISFAMTNDYCGATGAYLDRVSVGPVPTQTWNLDLGPGWNAISLPVVPANVQTVADWIADVNRQGGSVRTVYWWQHGAWHGGPPELQTAPPAVGHGYLLRADGPSRWTASGWPVEQAVPLTLDASWNLVGVPTPVTYTASSLVKTAAGQGIGLAQVVRWQYGTWIGYVEGYPFNDVPLQPGAAYFLLARQPGTLIP
ncbi:MAG: S8 family serine peptidase [Chloroflexi bacterium]|nr:S8 family serine peptidase [Chloroflexota bacterium]